MSTPSITESPARRRVRARLSALTSHHGPDATPVREARRDYAALALEEHAAEVVASWPPLSPEQRDRIAAVLFGAATAGGARP